MFSKKTSCKIIVFLSLIFLFPGCRHLPSKNKIYQVSTMKALTQGLFDGWMPVGKLKQKGDMGIGTFSGLNGELVLLDGNIYKVDFEGRVHKACLCQKIPLAVAVFFNPEIKLPFQGPLDWLQLQKELELRLPSKNIIYAVKIKGDFEYLKTRSVPGFTKPYPKLVDAVKSQRIFEFKDIKGTLVGFWYPKYFEGLNMPGFHLHFLSDAKDAGGHLFDFRIKSVVVEIGPSRSFKIDLPGTEDFYNADLTGNVLLDLKKAEADN